MIREEYRLIGKYIYRYDDDGRTIDKLNIDNEDFFRDIKITLRTYDNLYTEELFAANNDLTHRRNIYFEELFKLFGESPEE